MQKKRSFFDRLSGSRPLDDDFDTFEDEIAPAPRRASAPLPVSTPDRTEGQLPVDMYQNADEIVIRTFVAGVRPEEVNVSISRDMVVIEGSREERTESTGSDYFSQELFWGSFSRTIMLPQEIDVDNATASAKDGLLTITLPKLDKARQTKLRVRAS
jgi:HSP20 family protein